MLAAAAVAWLTVPATAQDAGQQGQQPEPQAQGEQPQQGQNPQQSEQAAAAQPEWVKICSENPKDKTMVCVVTRERRAATGELLAAVSLREVKDKKILIAAVPPGMLLKPGLRVQIDNNKPTEAAFSICFPNLCFAEAEVNADFVARLKRGNNLIVTSLTQQAKPVKFDISLVGFTKSYDGEAIDPKKLREEQQQLQDELKRKAEEARQQLIEKQRTDGQQGQ